MQTLFYGLIYQGTHPENTAPLKPAIFNLKEIFNDNFDPYLYEKEGRKPGIEVMDYKTYDQDFQAKLKELLEEIYNPEVPFDQTEVLKKCEYCPYKEICGR
jgi:MoaA/NifB/PqqE/SkfB family radical SAM enzyme